MARMCGVKEKALETAAAAASSVLPENNLFCTTA